MALSDLSPPVKPAVWRGRSFFALQGVGKCGDETPDRAARVWFQRTKTGGPTIYLFEKRPAKPITNWYSKTAFGWINENAALNLWLPALSGWCNFWPDDSFIGDELYRETDWSDHWIEFTDNREFTDGDSTELFVASSMHLLAKETNYKRQNQPWTTPAHVALAVSADPQGTPMAGPVFDPYSALADQQARLSKGQKVSSFQAKCTSAVDTVVGNNKTAAKAAAYLEAGRIANKQLTKLAAKSLPAMVRGYADTPIGSLVIANLALTAAQHFKPGNAQLAKLTEAMAAQAYAEIYANFKIEEMIDGFLADEKIQKALTAVSGD